MKSFFNRIINFIDERPQIGWWIYTNVGRIFLGMIMCVFGGVTETYILPLFMSDDAIDAFPLFRWIMFGGLGLLLAHFGIMMYWAVKNTISDIKEK